MGSRLRIEQDGTCLQSVVLVECSPEKKSLTTQCVAFWGPNVLEGRRSRERMIRTVIVGT